MDGILKKLGLEKVKTSDQTEKTKQFLNNLFKKVKKTALQN